MSKNLPPLIPQGDPESLLCRWCGAMRARVNGSLLCSHCDSPQGPAGEIGVATWSQDAKASPVDVGDTVRVVRGPHSGEVGVVTDRDTEDAMGFVTFEGNVVRAIPLKDLRGAS